MTKDKEFALPQMREYEVPNDMGVLDAIGLLSPKDWLWNGKGFYDNRPGSFSSFPDKQMVDYDEFKKRVQIAAKENSKW